MNATLGELANSIEQAATKVMGDSQSSARVVLRRSPNPKFGDVQTEIALALAKRAGAKPRELAERIVGQLDLAAVADSVDVSGPGFICLRLSGAFLGRVFSRCQTARAGVVATHSPSTIVIDYSSPNVAKEMHVGHLRSTIIGDCLARVFEFLGHRVVRQNHIGDWGTPFGMLIEHLRDLGEQAAAEELSVGDLDAFYRQARTKFDNDVGFRERARQRVVSLQGGDPDTVAAWRILVEQSTRYFERVYSDLGITLSSADIRGESFYNPQLPEIAEDLERRQLARTDQDALCVFPDGFSGREGEPLPLLIRKRDGGFGYATTDLAAIRYRVQELGANRLLYVVGAPQAQHLAMVFAVAGAAGYLPQGVAAEHVAFGSVLGADRKMFKSRAGGTVKLSDLLAEAVERAGKVVLKKNPQLDQQSRDAIARSVGIGAIKYADMSSDRIKDYVFDWERMMSMEGNTAPYVQYAHARIRSILRKADARNQLPADMSQVRPIVESEHERALALVLLELDVTLATLAESLRPHVLCGYLYNLANQFATFYNHCPVLRAETEERIASRLLMCDAVANVLSQGLSLLGIGAPERM